MKKLVATAPRVAALVEYEDRAILANEVKIRVRFGAPKHGTEVVDFRAASPFIDEDFNGEWQMFTPRPADALTGKQGADVIIETSGYADALQSALRGLAYGGTISYVAFAKPFAEGFNLGREAHFNNAKIVFSRACSEPNPDYPRWSRKRIEETCWELLMNGYLNCEDLIDPVVTFANSPESYMQYVDQHPEQSIKMGVTF
ncbi:zinc-binding dehydrogenase [Escherichia coli]|uniref:zinc-binding dehydrogenase n=1 Tax=Escherichia coli TaxID=562 RepID=UPI0031B5F26F